MTLPKTYPHTRIDKSSLEIGITARLRDKKYREALHFQPCAACGTEDNTVVGAHIRTGHGGGTSLKPADDENLPLCFVCHANQEANPGPAWWVENVLKRWARTRYMNWKTA